MESENLDCLYRRNGCCSLQNNGRSCGSDTTGELETLIAQKWVMILQSLAGQCLRSL